MPINPNALSSPEPDEHDPQTPGTGEEIAQEAQPKRPRRKKSEMIADAVIPAADEQIEVKDSDSGAKVQRPWSDAVALVKAQKAEFVDRAHHYAMLKADQQETASAFQTSDSPASQEPMDAADTVDLSGQTPPPATDASGQMLAPEGSEHGDEVVVGSKTYYVGPGGALVDGVVDAPAKRRWQRELGAGGDGPWESKESVHPGAFNRKDVPADDFSSTNGDPTFAQPTTHAPEKFDVQTERLSREVEQVDLLTWKIGTGILEKIGMPQVEQFASASQLQVGPISASRMVIDDGRRTVVPLGEGREGEVPTAVIEGFEALDNTVEFIARRFRGQLQSFLEATGAIKQPVS